MLQELQDIPLLSIDVSEGCRIRVQTHYSEANRTISLCQTMHLRDCV